MSPTVQHLPLTKPGALDLLPLWVVCALQFLVTHVCLQSRQFQESALPVGVHWAEFGPCTVRGPVWGPPWSYSWVVSVGPDACPQLICQGCSHMDKQSILTSLFSGRLLLLVQGLCQAQCLLPVLLRLQFHSSAGHSLCCQL